MASTVQKLPEHNRQIKAIQLRERAIDDALHRLKIQPINVRQFRIVAEYLDAFNWRGQLVDFREGK